MDRKLLLSILSLFLYLVSISQVIERLDKINGFKKFKFGVDLNFYTNLKLLKSSIILKDVKTYSYKKGDITDFYGVAIDDITLSFFKNKLYKISVSFGTIHREYTAQQYSIVQENLEGNFGSDYHSCSNGSSEEILNCSLWDASKVRLESIRIQINEKDGSRNSNFNYIQGYILFTDKRIQKLQQNSELEE